MVAVIETSLISTATWLKIREKLILTLQFLKHFLETANIITILSKLMQNTASDPEGLIKLCPETHHTPLLWHSIRVLCNHLHLWYIPNQLKHPHELPGKDLVISPNNQQNRGMVFPPITEEVWRYIKARFWLGFYKTDQIEYSQPSKTDGKDNTRLNWCVWCTKGLWQQIRWNMTQNDIQKPTHPFSVVSAILFTAEIHNLLFLEHGDRLVEGRLDRGWKGRNTARQVFYGIIYSSLPAVCPSSVYSLKLYSDGMDRFGWSKFFLVSVKRQIQCFSLEIFWRFVVVSVSLAIWC